MEPPQNLFVSQTSGDRRLRPAGARCHCPRRSLSRPRVFTLVVMLAVALDACAADRPVTTSRPGPGSNAASGSGTRVIQFHYRRKPVVPYGEWIVWGNDRDPVPAGLPPERTLAYSSCVRVYPPRTVAGRTSFYKKPFVDMVHDLLGDAATVEQGIDVLTHGAFPDKYQGVSAVAALERADVRRWFAEEAQRVLDRTHTAGLFYDNMPVFAQFRIADVPAFQPHIVETAREIRRRVGDDVPITFNGLTLSAKALALELAEPFDFGMNEGMWFRRRQKADRSGIAAHEAFFRETMRRGCKVWLVHTTSDATEAGKAWLLAKLICPDAYLWIGDDYTSPPRHWAFYDIELGRAEPMTQRGDVFERVFEHAVIRYDRAQDQATWQRK